MPTTQTYGFSYEDTNDQPGHTLNGGELGGSPILAIEVDQALKQAEAIASAAATAATAVIDSGTYTPVITATGTNPVLGSTGFLTGKWYRIERLITVIVDLNIQGPGLDLGGSSWRISLPFQPDNGFHDAGPLDSASDIVGNYVSRSETSAESTTGAALLGTTSEIGGKSLIFYSHGSSGSVGSSDFTTDARLKANVHYLVSASQF